MNHVIKSVRLSTPTVSPNQFGKGTAGLRHRQVATVSSKPERDGDMDKTRNPQEPTEETEDVMSHSFGEGYATRSDEEGFGGTYGRNQSDRSRANIKADKEIHENHPAFDKSQGSEVKEKEKGRHQTNAS